MTVPGVPDHGHCEICAEPVARGQRFCGSKSCDDKHQQNVRDKKRQVYLLVGVIAGAVLLSKLLGGW